MVVNYTFSFVRCANEDETKSNSKGNGDIYEDVDEIKRRLLPTLTATYEQGNHVTVWRMPIEISQSRLAGRYKPSNACTIIARCSTQLLNAFINAIIEGNEIHEQQMVKRRSFCCSYFDRHAETFTIPQALEGCNNIFQEIEYITVRGKIIYNLKTFLLMPIKGGLIAMCSVNDLDCLIKWMCENVFPETTYKLNYDQSFEVSVIAFKGELHNDDRPLFVPRVVETLHIFPRQHIDQTFHLQL
ncbi:hypothetical protein DINM_005040 [Dirofilaria immitis]|nr:hypothetical protein [Dirofilaria immitis]